MSHKVSRRPHMRGGPINRELHYFCKTFLRTGEVPSSHKLKAVISTTDLQKSQMPSVFGHRFVNWASKMKLNKEGQLVVKETSQVIPPRENYRHLVAEIHKKHCRFHGRMMAMPRCHNKIISILGEKYAVGHRNFGLSRKEIRKIICSLHGSVTKAPETFTATTDGEDDTMDTSSESDQSDSDSNASESPPSQDLQVILVDDNGQKRKASFSPEEKHIIENENSISTQIPTHATKSISEPIQVGSSKIKVCKTLAKDFPADDISLEIKEAGASSKKFSSWGKGNEVSDASGENHVTHTTEHLNMFKESSKESAGDHGDNPDVKSKSTRMQTKGFHVLFPSLMKAIKSKSSSQTHGVPKPEPHKMTKGSHSTVDTEKTNNEEHWERGPTSSTSLKKESVFKSCSNNSTSNKNNSTTTTDQDQDLGDIEKLAYEFRALPSESLMTILTDYSVDSDPGSVCGESPWLYPGMLEGYPSISGHHSTQVTGHYDEEMVSPEIIEEDSFGGFFQKLMEDFQILAHDIRQAYCLGRRQPLDRVRRGISIAQTRLQQCHAKLYQIMSQSATSTAE